MTGCFGDVTGSLVVGFVVDRVTKGFVVTLRPISYWLGAFLPHLGGGH